MIVNDVSSTVDLMPSTTNCPVFFQFY